jgi:hypothetical protein
MGSVFSVGVSFGLSIEFREMLPDFGEMLGAFGDELFGSLDLPLQLCGKRFKIGTVLGNEVVAGVSHDEDCIHFQEKAMIVSIDIAEWLADFSPIGTVGLYSVESVGH